KNAPLTDVPGASVSVAEIRCFSNLNSDTFWYRIDGLRDVGLGGLRNQGSGLRVGPGIRIGCPKPALIPEPWALRPTASEHHPQGDLALLPRLRARQLAESTRPRIGVEAAADAPQVRTAEQVEHL